MANKINKNLREIVKDPLKSYNVASGVDLKENILFDKLEIEEVFDKMNTKKASNDPIPNILLKIVGSLCSSYITHIFNKVIESKTWP